jgi:cytochrome c2
VREERHTSIWLWAFAVVMLVLAIGATFDLTRYRTKATRERLAHAVALTNGDPGRGRAAITQRGCGGCHEIPGIVGAGGRVGPPLKGFAGRAMIGGVVANDTGALVQWLRDPRSIDPKSGMPNLGLGEAEARDVAAYLFMLD